MTPTSTSAFLLFLRSLDIRLWAEGDRLRYSAPPGALTPELRAELTTRKAELLAFLQQADKRAHTRLPAITPAPRDRPIPLSFAQQRLWFLDQLDPRNPAYHVPIALRLSGRLDIPALARSLNTIIRRHENLRTSFVVRDGQPGQVIAPALNIALPVVDVCAMPECERAAEIRRLTTEEARRPFDLAHGPLLRATLLRQDETEHVLVLTMHHIISDGWSDRILIRELAALYRAFVAGQPDPLAALPIQYADFAVWQRYWLRGEVQEAQLAYWRQRLGGTLPILQLPTDRPRPVIQSLRGTIHPLLLPGPLTEALLRFSQREGVTLFMTLLAAFTTLLYRYTDQTDILVGSPIANRNRSEIEGLIGFFVNLLVLRADLSGNPSFQDLLGRVREVALEGFAHQDVPFEHLVEVLQPERSLSHQPLCQVVFALHNAPLPAIELPGLTLTQLGFEIEAARFDLTLYLEEYEQGLRGSLQYNTDLFDATTIARMADHFQILLAGIVAYPERRIEDLPLLSPAERRQLLVEWNASAPYPDQHCFHQLFEAQVERTPDAVAVTFEGASLSYRALNQRANQLAHYLQKQGVELETLVGIALERSLELVVAVLGVLKAGAAYVPLDPTYPPERLRFMLADSQVAVLLTRRQLAEALPIAAMQQRHRIDMPESAAIHPAIVYLDSDWPAIAGESTHNPGSAAHPESLAYIIYTSGSTGRPKGAMLCHRGLCNLAEIQRQVFDIQEGKRVLQFASLSFDASVWELVMALANGATLCLAHQQTLASGPDLQRLLWDQQITTVTLPPSLLNVLAPEELPALETVIAAGEPCGAELVARWAPGRQFFNAYGPTEATICATLARCDVPDATDPPIGRALANVQIYILDRNGQPVPVGIPGEIHIGGVGLARGYLNRPDLSAEKFIPNPFSNDPGARLYKTGDLARYRPDGNLEFLGRLDQQVKLRGFRIELGEIEAALRQHPAVGEAVAVVHADNRQDKRLIAYIVPRNPGIEHGALIGSQLQSAMRDFLRERLPNYMLPAAFVTLDALPLLPNGKIDRVALAARAIAQPADSGTYVAPRHQVETLLARIWAELLGIERVGVYDDFFALGGHSLLATRLIFRVRELFKVEMPLQSFFTLPTIAGQAQTLATIQRGGAAVMIGATPAIDLQAEAMLPATISAETLPRPEAAEPGAVLLTGASGFLGAFLLHELLQQTGADIYCLVRAPDIEQGRRRIQHNLETYKLWEQRLASRIIPVPGNLAQPGFGLAPQQFHALAEQIDAIYHNGALVNLVYPYDKLKPINVLGTQEILRLATHSRALPVHYVSTLSVFESLDYFDGRVIREAEEPVYGTGLLYGYAQSKWVAEKLVLAARSRGLPVVIYRPGAVAGDSRTGIWNTDDYICRLIKGAIQLGSISDLDTVLRLTPVDYVSRAIIQLSRQPAALGQHFHIATPHQLHIQQLADWIEAYGYPLRRMTYARWQAELIAHSMRAPQQALSTLLPLFVERVAADRQLTIPELFVQGREPQFDISNLLSALAGTTSVCPPVDAELLGIYFGAFIRSGFLEAPSSVVRSGRS